MKSAVLLILSFLLLSIFVNHAQGSRLGFRPEKTKCPMKQIYSGRSCGSDGRATCAGDFKKERGAATEPTDCICFDVGPKEHLCQCSLLC